MLNLIMARLKDKYYQEVLPKLKEELTIKNNLAVPKVKKVVINIGAGDAKDNQGILDRVVQDVTSLAGQKPVITKSKKSISGFKLGKGQPVGIMVTLRKEKMYEFLDKLISVVLPKVRDFRGLPRESFDGQGNYTLGMREQTIFPEVGFRGTSSGVKIRGLEISIVTTAKSKKEGERLLELLGVPFRES